MTITRPSQKSMRKVRARLIKANPHCYWCNVLTTAPAAFILDPNSATVDHVKPRRECKSQSEYDAPTNHVLACFECNQERDRVDIALMEHQRQQQAFVDRLRVAKRRVLVRTGR